MESDYLNVRQYNWGQRFQKVCAEKWNDLHLRESESEIKSARESERERRKSKIVRATQHSQTHQTKAAPLLPAFSLPLVQNSNKV